MTANYNYILGTLVSFLSEHPDLYNKKGKNDLTDPLTYSGKQLIKKRIEDYWTKAIVPSIPKTIPDPLVSLILEKYYDIAPSKLEAIQNEHLLSMASENKVGEYLELYIADVAHYNLSWVHCVDGIVRAIDFIKNEDGEWKMLQVKNRSNSENSSSRNIRKFMQNEYNKEIIKWHRVDARSGEYRWDQFPDCHLKNILNEDDFRLFLSNYLEKIKNRLGV